MGFNWAQSSAALKTHATLEQAVEALFGEEGNPGRGGNRPKKFEPCDRCLRRRVLHQGFISSVSLSLSLSRCRGLPGRRGPVVGGAAGSRRGRVDSPTESFQNSAGQTVRRPKQIDFTVPDTSFRESCETVRRLIESFFCLLGWFTKPSQEEKSF